MRVRQLQRCCEYAGGGTRAHNTLSAETTHVQVFYPFHPLHGTILRVVRRPKRGDGAISVIGENGKRLKIPVWMLLPDSADVTIAATPHLSKEALLALVSVLSTHLRTDHDAEDNLLPKVVDRRKGGQHRAAATSGPDDPKGKRARTRGRKGAK